MAEPTKIEWDCGRDAYGRRVTLHYERGAAGQKSGFTIKRDELNQLDEPSAVHLLTAENLQAIAEAAKGLRHG